MLNKSILMGRLTADPELRTTQNGTSVVSFCLAVNRDYDKEKTDFINIVAWRQTAEFVSKYFSKGQLVAIDGAIQTRSYTDKQGNNRTAFEVVADHVHFAESKSSSANSNSANSGFCIGDYEEIDTDDNDLPF